MLFAQLREKLWKLVQMIQFDEFIVADFFLSCMLVKLGLIMWDVDRLPTDAQNWQDIRTQRIPHHQKPLQIKVVFVQDPLVSDIRFLSHYFEVAKIPGYSRAFDLALLLEKISFGDQHQIVKFR